MAIYRIGGYTGGLVREAPETPIIDSPEKGEKLLLKALNGIEKYSRQLVFSHDKLIFDLKNRLENVGKVAEAALSKENEFINDFQLVSENQFREFDKLMEITDDLANQLVYVDKLFTDVNQLSDLLTSLEQMISSR